MPKQITGKGRGGGGSVPEIEAGIRTLVDLSIKNQEIRDKVRIDKKLQERGERFKPELPPFSAPLGYDIPNNLGDFEEELTAPSRGHLEGLFRFC